MSDVRSAGVILALALLLAGCSPTVASAPVTLPNPQPTPPAASVSTPTQNGAISRPAPLAAVYNPDRLQVLDPSKTVTGTVEAVLNETDGDYHIRLRLDPAYADLINDRNRTGQHGDLVLEIIPADRDELRAPKAGSHVRVTGAYVLDRDHGWMELHPIWVIKDLANGARQVAPPPTPDEIAHPKG